MSDYNRYSRVNKFEKRRKNTKLMSLLIILGSFLIVLLIGIWIFGPDEDDKAEEQEFLSTNNDEVDEQNDSGISNDDTESVDLGETDEADETSAQVDDQSSQSEDETDGANYNNAESNRIVETEQADPLEEDENVISAFTSPEWKPIGTVQQEPHSLVFDDGSQDRIEMEMAIQSATGLSELDMITWWLQRAGDQQVIGTVSDKAETVVYRVYLSWVENEGWQPTLVEILEENDQKYRFE